MTFRQFAFNNVIRNKRLYAAYFLTSLFTVMVFFTFSIFAFHPVLSGENMNGYVSIGMNVASGIIYVFSFFFVLYSMSSFLQSRKKEFGLLMIQGMSMKQIRLMVFLENMFIGFFATLGGIVGGLVFAKGILLIAENVLIIDDELPFYFPNQAILLTFGSFIVLFFLISLFVSYILRSRKLINLIKGDKQSKGEPKANLFLTLSAVLLLGTGYTIALLVEGLEVVAALLPVVLLVIIGTYLLFTQLSVFVIRRLKKQEQFFWHKTNMILLSDLSFRMKDNARTFFLVAIISTVAFCAIGSLYGFQSYLTAGTKEQTPYTITYTDAENGGEANASLIEETLEAEQLEADGERIELRYYEKSDQSLVLIAKQSDYNRFAALLSQETIHVSDGSPVLIRTGLILFEDEHAGSSEAEVLENAALELKGGSKLEPNQLVESDVLPGSAGNYYYVVSDHDFENLPVPSSEQSYYAWQERNGESISVEASEKLDQEVTGGFITNVSYQEYILNKIYGPILFVGLFIGIVFFVSAGSFLYFRLYSDVDEDKRKFQAITKMGLTEKELKKVLNRQTLILFFAPILVALIHGAVALTALSHLFFYNLFIESVTVLSLFTAIQIVYFFIVRFYYTKQVKAALQ
ncbi:ABC transporter permease [Gracilibacillus alcaliphilus]|uniref:ABC transporter permease n=1 Tax=Gracilibacillus alcaliphilus TaxID=1401441 RepID=UPI0019575E52|nr:ABC transporter permease [Gracilibacillus alcaliphilus]MBM7676479.1 putative ABC transport system permease protein [Gracilibacillus alcaliphilus]